MTPPTSGPPTSSTTSGPSNAPTNPQPGAPGGAGSFRIDPAEATVAIRELRQAAEELSAIRKDAQALGQVDPGSRDSVSVEAAQLISQVAVGGPDNLVDALRSGIAQIEALATQMENELAAYHQTDQAAGDRFNAQA